MDDNKKYTDQQLLFLGYLGAEAKGDIEVAMKMAEYHPGYKGQLIKLLKSEIVEIASNMVAGNSTKAARAINDLLDDPNKPGAPNILKAAAQILDRAGVVKSEDVSVKIPTSGLFILPAKSGMKIVQEDKEKEDDDES